MEIFLILGAIAVICCVLAILKRQPKKGKKFPPARVSQAVVSKNQNRFQATKVVAGNDACLAAQDLQGTFFLKNQYTKFTFARMYPRLQLSLQI